MLEPDGSPNTAHSLNPVPLIVTCTAARLRHPPVAGRSSIGGPSPTDEQSGVLADVAPTVLELLGIAQPPEMTGRSLIEAGRPEA
jgi:2,3-bisphosphoglycerate-independent phosphoglycerate mutase